MLDRSSGNQLVALAVIVLLSACNKTRPTVAPFVAEKVSIEAVDDPTLPSHQRMVRLLEYVQQKTLQADFFVGNGRAEYLEKVFSELPADATPLEQFRAKYDLAEAYLNLGETKQAIALFEECFKIQPTINAPDLEYVRDYMQFDLAVAYLRLAEDENCIYCRNGESCILPIQGGGIHEFTSGAENAIQHFTAFLKRNPQNASARWLLNVAYMTLGKYPQQVPEQWLIAPEVFESELAFPRFTNIAEELGLDHVSLCGGMVVDDLNNDGWLDVMTSNYDPSGHLKCYLSNGDGTFTDATERSGLAGILGGLNMLQADYDNDGDVDVYVLRGAWLDEYGCIPNSLLANDGTGRFQDVTFDVGLGDQHVPTQTAAWADYDNDGDLDLAVGNEMSGTLLYNNDGQGHFLEVAAQARLTCADDWRLSKGTAWGDYDNDRYPDLYVTNLDGPNCLYHNNRDGTFTEVAKQAGVQRPMAAFPTWFWDYNNDGALDLFVCACYQSLDAFVDDYLGKPIQAETDRLFQGNGQGSFEDVSEDVGLDRITVAMGSNFGDLDNDGFLDYYLGTGYPSYAGLMPNRMFHNLHGKQFVEVTNAGGFGHLQKGHGIAFADFDHDGDQDVFIELGGAYRGDAFANAVFENPGFGNHWIAIKLVGQGSNRSGIGARIRATIEEQGKARSVYKWVNSGGSFGCNPLRQHIGLGSAEVIQELEIYWPTTDTTQRFTNVAVDQIIKITEGQPEFSNLP